MARSRALTGLMIVLALAGCARTIIYPAWLTPEMLEILRKGAQPGPLPRANFILNLPDLIPIGHGCVVLGSGDSSGTVAVGINVRVLNNGMAAAGNAGAASIFTVKVTRLDTGDSLSAAMPGPPLRPSENRNIPRLDSFSLAPGTYGFLTEVDPGDPSARPGGEIWEADETNNRDMFSCTIR